MLDVAWIEKRLGGGGTLNGLTLPEERLLRAHARECGLKVEGLIATWRREAGTAGGRGHKKPLDPDSGPRVSKRDIDAGTNLLLDGLDYWSDDQPVMPEDDGEVGETTEQQVCPDCGGAGFGDDGEECQRCGGTGRVAADDNEDDNDEDEFNDE